MGNRKIPDYRAIIFITDYVRYGNLLPGKLNRIIFDKVLNIGIERNDLPIPLCLTKKSERISFTESSPYSSTISIIFQTAIFISSRPYSEVL